MARGQAGSLFLTCVISSITAPRRFIPTLSLSICLPPLSELTRVSPSQLRLLRPGFRRVDHSHRRRIYLRWQLGKFHRRVSHPLEHQLASLHPYGGFSPVRLQGRYFRRGLPGSRALPSAGLPSPFVPIAYHVESPHCVRETWCASAPPLERLRPLYPRGPRSSPGYSVPAHLHLSDPMRPTRRHTPTSPHCGLYGMPSLCAYTTTPRQPTTGSELSLMFFHNMSPSGTPGNSSAACAQYFTEDAGLQLQGTVSAFPIILTLRFW
jgi:hypothetical protein